MLDGLIVVFAYIVGHYMGWRAGIEQTERRWSDAVKKAEYQRKEGAIR